MISKVRTKAPAAGGLLNRDLCVFHLIKAQVSAVELSRTLALSTNWHLYLPWPIGPGYRQDS